MAVKRTNFELQGPDATERERRRELIRLDEIRLKELEDKEEQDAQSSK